MFSKLVKENAPSLDFFTKSKVNSTVHIDKDPFFKPAVLKLRHVIELNAEFGISKFIPVLFSFIFTMIFTYVFREKYDYIVLLSFGRLELFVILIILAICNVASAMMSFLKLHKVRETFSHFLSIVVMLIVTGFNIEWFFTPGTNIFVNIDIITFSFIFWNYIGFSVVSILRPGPIWMKNAFTVLFSSQICSFVCLMFDAKNIYMIPLYLAFWDFLSHIVAPANLEHNMPKRGIFFTHFLKKKKSDKMPASSTTEYVDGFETHDSMEGSHSNLKILNVSNVSTTVPSSSVTHSYKLRLKPLTPAITEDTGIIGEVPLNKKYGPDAVAALEEACEKIISRGSNMSLNAIVFYVLVAMSVPEQGNYVGIFLILQITGLGILVQNGIKIFFTKQIPIKIFIILISLIFSKVIQDIISPFYKHIAFSRIGDVQLLHEKLSP